jgi:hypothetical protein
MTECQFDRKLKKINYQHFLILNNETKAVFITKERRIQTAREFSGFQGLGARRGTKVGDSVSLAGMLEVATA